MQLDKVIFWEIPRVASEILQGFGTVSVADVSEALHRTSVMHHEMKPLVHGIRLVGPAVTAINHLGDNIMVHKALQVARKGDVVVICGHGQKDHANWGELVALSAKARGIAGAIIDGATRDAGPLRAMRYPVWTRGVTPLGAAKSNPGSINVPVVCAGVLVKPGDIIVADDDGVAVVPGEAAETVLRRALERKQTEVEWRRRALDGELLYDHMGLDAVFKSNEVVEFRRKYNDAEQS